MKKLMTVDLSQYIPATSSTGRIHNSTVWEIHFDDTIVNPATDLTVNCQMAVSAAFPSGFSTAVLALLADTEGNKGGSILFDGWTLKVTISQSFYSPATPPSPK